MSPPTLQIYTVVLSQNCLNSWMDEDLATFGDICTCNVLATLFKAELNLKSATDKPMYESSSDAHRRT